MYMYPLIDMDKNFMYIYFNTNYEAVSIHLTSKNVATVV